MGSLRFERAGRGPWSSELIVRQSCKTKRSAMGWLSVTNKHGPAEGTEPGVCQAQLPLSSRTVRMVADPRGLRTVLDKYTARYSGWNLTADNTYASRRSVHPWLILPHTNQAPSLRRRPH